MALERKHFCNVKWCYHRAALAFEAFQYKGNGQFHVFSIKREPTSLAVPNEDKLFAGYGRNLRGGR